MCLFLIGQWEMCLVGQGNFSVELIEYFVNLHSNQKTRWAKRKTYNKKEEHRSLSISEILQKYLRFQGGEVEEAPSAVSCDLLFLYSFLGSDYFNCWLCSANRLFSYPQKTTGLLSIRWTLEGFQFLPILNLELIGTEETQIPQSVYAIRIVQHKKIAYDK